MFFFCKFWIIANNIYIYDGVEDLATVGLCLVFTTSIYCHYFPSQTAGVSSLQP